MIPKPPTRFRWNPDSVMPTAAVEGPVVATTIESAAVVTPVTTRAM